MVDTATKKASIARRRVLEVRTALETVLEVASDEVRAAPSRSLVLCQDKARNARRPTRDANPLNFAGNILFTFLTTAAAKSRFFAQLTLLIVRHCTKTEPLTAHTYSQLQNNRNHLQHICNQSKHTINRSTNALAEQSSRQVLINACQSPKPDSNNPQQFRLAKPTADSEYTIPLQPIGNAITRAFSIYTPPLGSFQAIYG